ncbi:hypothetical protein BH10ACT3_BH10ACT3_15090 [soil metagenome]
MAAPDLEGFVDVELRAGTDVLVALDEWLSSRAGVVVSQQRTDAAVRSPEPLPRRPVPFVIGVTGSVAVGKSTIAEQVAARIEQWPDAPAVQIVTSDAFLFPNSVLEQRGLSMQKGFPPSYDRDALVSFLIQLRRGVAELPIPVYSHVRYDVLPDEHVRVDQPDVLILEGLGLLGTDLALGSLVSDHLDVAIHVDAAEADIERWFVERFAKLRVHDFDDDQSFYLPFAARSDEESAAIARWTWSEINAVNLREHVLPVRNRADLVLHKDGDHQIVGVSLRTA